MVTKDDIMRAIKISQTLQDYFDKNNGTGKLRSTDAYDILVRTNAVETDRHSGIKFRDFLRHLKNNNELSLIPQCRTESSGTKNINWFFESAPGKTQKARNLKPIEKIGQILTISESNIQEKIQNLPKRESGSFTDIELLTRQKYNRAFVFWTQPEEDLLLEVVKEITDAFKLSELFKRQPSAIKNRLKIKHNIII